MGYFHLVFALPHEFNRLILAHKKIGLSLLFKAVSETLLEFGQTRLKGTLGIIAVLHTWDQTLKDHFHLHCLGPRRRSVFGSQPLDWSTAKLSVSCHRSEPGVSGKVSRLSYNRPVIKEKSRRPTTRSKHHAKRAGWSTPKSRSVLHRPCSITSAATPTAWLCPMTASSTSKTVRSLSPTGTAKTKIG